MKHLIFILIHLEHLALELSREAFVVAYQLLVQSGFVSSRPSLCHITICWVHVCERERQREKEIEIRERERETERYTRAHRMRQHRKRKKKLVQIE